jgi:sulfonate transport system permease protein
MQALKALLLPALLAIGWQLGASEHWLNPLLSSPVAIGDAAREFWASGELAQHLAVSLRRMLLGLTLGVLAGVALGGLMSLSQ